jgi:hypothetical protein
LEEGMFKIVNVNVFTRKGIKKKHEPEKAKMQQM